MLRFVNVEINDLRIWCLLNEWNAERLWILDSEIQLTPDIFVLRCCR
jgi:hypothetical protein